MRQHDRGWGRRDTTSAATRFSDGAPGRPRPRARIGLGLAVLLGCWPLTLDGARPPWPTGGPKGSRPKTALQIALNSGQHSLASLLLKSGYRLDLERYAPLDLALEARRWDLFDLLLEHGAELKDADVYTVLDTYNVELYERLRAAGYELTERHEMASMPGHGTTNRPLLGFVKRRGEEDPKIQRELNIALGHHVRAGNERGVSLCLWAGADPHAPAPNPELGVAADADEGDGEEHFVGFSAIEGAASAAHLA